MKNNELEKFRQSVIEYGMVYKKYIEIMNLWLDVTKYLGELRDQYKNNPTYELRNKISEWEFQEKDYYELFNEYQNEILKIGFDNDYDEKVEIIELCDLFEKLTDEIKLIENRSKKYGSKKEIGTNRIETLNAEGRKKYIHEYLLEDYNSLVNQKKNILSRYRELYRKYIDINNENVVNKIDVVDIENESLVDEGMNLEKYYFDKMTVEEKINYYRERINNIVKAKNTGKKVRINVYAKSYNVPVKYKHLVIEYLKNIKDLEESLNNNIVHSKTSIIDVGVDNSVVESKKEDKDDNYVDIVSFITDNEEEKQDNIVVESKKEDKDDNYVDIVSLITDNEEERQENISDDRKNEFVLNGNFQVYSPDDDCKVNFVNSNVKNESRDIWSDSSLIPDSEKKTSESVQPSSIMNSCSALAVCPRKYEIIEVKKPRKKFDLKKKILTAVAAVVVAITTALTAVSVFAMSGFGKNNKDDTVDNKIVYEDMTPILPIDNLRDQIISNINSSDDSLDTKINSNSDSPKFKIGDTVNIKNNSYIYDNVYDAMNEENGLEPYFDYGLDRDVKGFFVNCNGDFTYSEDQIVVDSLLNQGGIVESVVVGEYEGAYNYSDIKVKEKVR